MSFDQAAFNNFVVENGVYGFFEDAITLKSGRKSHFYCNWRNVVEDAWLTDRLADFVLDFVADNGLEVDTFYGVPEGATKLGVLTQYKWAQRSGFLQGSHVLAMGRKVPKDHGHPKDRFFVGAPKGKVIVLEDVATTAGSAIECLKSLQQAEFEISAMIILTDRMELRDDGQSAKQAIEALGLPYYYVSSALDILPLVYRKLQPGEKVARAIEAEYEQYGVSPLKLLP